MELAMQDLRSIWAKHETNLGGLAPRFPQHELTLVHTSPERKHVVSKSRIREPGAREIYADTVPASQPLDLRLAENGF